METHRVIVKFFIPGEPVPKGRGRAGVVNGHAHVFTPSKTRNYENFVKGLAAEAMRGRTPVDGPVMVDITVWLPIPASMSRKHQVAAVDASLLPAKKPDIDNCAKSVTDGLNAIVFCDDRQIVDLHVRKRYSRVPGVAVEVHDLA